MYMATWRYEVSPRVLKNISQVSSVNKLNTFLREEKFRIFKQPFDVLFMI